MNLFRTNSSETLSRSPVRVVRLADGRSVKKISDRSFLKKKDHDIRSHVQLFFLALTLWIGVEFYLFVRELSMGITPTISRPPGVEGFLPISALVSFRYFLLTGIVNNVHPSGFIIFTSALLISLFMKKGFCSWICPVGYISESLYQLGSKVFGRSFTLPKWIDVPLRSLKYLLLAFFMVSVSAMSAVELQEFISSDYNKVADIKMFLFFAHISSFAIAVFGILILLSLVYKNFWCRYGCPYGALLGIGSLVSPLKIRRNETNCIDCGKCATACPSDLNVDKLESVSSPECNACFSCVTVCPVKDTLMFSVGARSKGISQRTYALVLLAVYFGIVGSAFLSGHWQNSIQGKEYLALFNNINAITHAF